MGKIHGLSIWFLLGASGGVCGSVSSRVADGRWCGFSEGSRFAGLMLASSKGALEVLTVLLLGCTCMIKCCCVVACGLWLRRVMVRWALVLSCRLWLVVWSSLIHPPFFQALPVCSCLSRLSGSDEFLFGVLTLALLVFLLFDCHRRSLFLSVTDLNCASVLGVGLLAMNPCVVVLFHGCVVSRWLH